jgi:hypothetical protein
MPAMPPEAHNQAMPLLYFLADAFIKTFGITQPTDKTRRQAALFILGLILLLLTTVVVAGFAIHVVMK